MTPSADDSTETARDGLVQRVDGIAAWINDLDTRVRAAELATSDEKSAKELRRAVEALSKHDPKLEKRLTNRVDVLADRLATLASTVSTTAASLARKDGEIASLRKELEDGQKRIGELVRELGKSAQTDEVERLREAIRAVQVERPARTGDARLDELGRKVDYLSERVDTLGKTVGTTAAGLVGREGEIATLRQRLDEASAHIEQTAVELRRVQGDGAFAHRLDALQTALEATNAELTTRETEVFALRSRIDEAYSRVGTVVAELQGSISTLSAQVSALETLPATTEQALEARAAELSRHIDLLAERLESLATNVEFAMRGLVDRQADVARLTQRADEASAHVDAVIAELRQALVELPAPGAVEGEVEARFEELGSRVVAVTDQLNALDTRSSVHAEDAAARAAAVEAMLGRADTRLQALEREREALAAQLEHEGAAWSEEREWVRARLDELAAAESDASRTRAGLAPLLGELTARLDSMESAQAAGATELARVSAALAAEHERLHAQLEVLATRVADATESGSREASESLLRDLATRLHSLEEAGGAVAAEMARATAHWVAELETIETRLDQVTAASDRGATGADAGIELLLSKLSERIDTMERDRQAVAAEIARVSEAWHAERSSLEERVAEVASHLAEVESDARVTTGTAPDREVAQLRVAVDGLRMRLASSEQELAAVVGTRDTGARLDELTRRLESLERAPIILPGVDSSPLPGDGRFRLELRALELRLEHAEVAARENREAVLVQLERLAARIEWRFQRLEAEDDSAQPRAVGGGGQVVPLRPTEGTV